MPLNHNITPRLDFSVIVFYISTVYIKNIILLCWSYKLSLNIKLISTTDRFLDEWYLKVESHFWRNMSVSYNSPADLFITWQKYAWNRARKSSLLPYILLSTGMTQPLLISLYGKMRPFYIPFLSLAFAIVS